MGACNGAHRGRIIVWAIVAPLFLLSASLGSLMPLRTAAGVFVVICSGDGPLGLYVDPETGQPVDHDPSDRHGICDWAGLRTGAYLQAPSPAPVEPERGFVMAVFAMPAILVAGRVTGLPLATGPPLVI